MPPTPQPNQTTDRTPPAAAEPEFVFVENTSKQLHGIPKALGKTEAQAAGALIQPMALNLMPGLNKVSIPIWEKAKEQKMVDLHIKEGTFREHAGVSNFGSIGPDEAKNLISLCVDVKLLEEWRQLDKRANVQKFIDVRLSAIRSQEPGTVRPDQVAGLK